jgi:hypothetical protein
MKPLDLLRANNAWEAAEQFAEAEAGRHSAADLISRVVPNPFNKSREGEQPYLSVYAFGDHIITLPSHVEPRWNQCIKANRLLMWRGFAFLLSAEAKMAELEGNNDMRDDLLTLFEVAMQRVYSLQPDFYAQEPKPELEKV